MNATTTLHAMLGVCPPVAGTPQNRTYHICSIFQLHSDPRTLYVMLLLLPPPINVADSFAVHLVAVSVPAKACPTRPSLFCKVRLNTRHQLCEIDNGQSPRTPHISVHAHTCNHLVWACSAMVSTARSISWDSEVSVEEASDEVPLKDCSILFNMLGCCLTASLSSLPPWRSRAGSTAHRKRETVLNATPIAFGMAMKNQSLRA